MTYSRWGLYVLVSISNQNPDLGNLIVLNKKVKQYWSIETLLVIQQMNKTSINSFPFLLCEFEAQLLPHTSNNAPFSLHLDFT